MSELRAAAERIRDWRLNPSPADALALADAYLAEHPADDNEPITEEWLLEIGFWEYGEKKALELHASGSGVVVIWVPRTGCWFLGAKDYISIPLPYQKTRRDLRRLLQALGIQEKAK